MNNYYRVMLGRGSAFASKCKTRFNYIRQLQKYPESFQDDDFKKMLSNAGYFVQ